MIVIQSGKIWGIRNTIVCIQTNDNLQVEMNKREATLNWINSHINDQIVMNVNIRHTKLKSHNLGIPGKILLSCDKCKG